MNDPRNELIPAVKSLTLAPTLSAQHTAIEKYFAPDAGFLHPMCTVERGPGSRERIRGIYEWYRDMSPDISLEVEHMVYDEAQSTAYLTVVQSFHIFLSPFKPKPARLLGKIILQRNSQDRKYYIVQQEDYYQPEDILNLTLPPLSPALTFLKSLSASICGVNAFLFSYARELTHKGMDFFGMGREKMVNGVNSIHVHQE